MLTAFFWIVLFSASTATSVALLGSRDLISGNLFEWGKILSLVLNWRFILSMVFALLSRMAFIMTNNAVLKVPRLENAATTITTFGTTALGLIFVIMVNYFFLQERINMTQGIGAVLLFVGIFLISK